MTRHTPHALLNTGSPPTSNGSSALACLKSNLTLSGPVTTACLTSSPEAVPLEGQQWPQDGNHPPIACPERARLTS